MYKLQAKYQKIEELRKSRNGAAKTATAVHPCKASGQQTSHLKQDKTPERKVSKSASRNKGVRKTITAIEDFKTPSEITRTVTPMG